MPANAGMPEFFRASHSVLNLCSNRSILRERPMEIAGSVGAILAHKGSAVWSIASSATVFEAIQMMADKNIGALPVIDGGKLVGIISERDYTRKVILKGKSSRDTPVGDVMTRELVTTDPEGTVTECMRLMTEKRVRHLPVMVEGKMIGILSIGDLVKRIITAQTAAIDNLEKYITGDYPA
jgi:CBS domain-containing protein